MPRVMSSTPGNHSSSFASEFYVASCITSYFKLSPHEEDRSSVSVFCVLGDTMNSDRQKCSGAEPVRFFDRANILSCLHVLCTRTVASQWNHCGSYRALPGYLGRSWTLGGTLAATVTSNVRKTCLRLKQQWSTRYMCLPLCHSWESLLWILPVSPLQNWHETARDMSLSKVQGHFSAVK